MRLVIFDLDRTITRRDTLWPYVVGFCARRPWRLVRILRVLPPLAGFALGCVGRGTLKAALIRAVLGGQTRTQIEHWTGEFVPHLLAGGVNREALVRIEQHRAAGDVLVLLSASPDLYVPAIARELGFREALCTGVRWSGERLEGGLASANRRGREKTRCLEVLRERYPGLGTVGYADSLSDLDHLRRLDQAFLVNGSRRARRAARRLGIERVSWA